MLFFFSLLAACCSMDDRAWERVAVVVVVAVVEFEFDVSNSMSVRQDIM